MMLEKMADWYCELPESHRRFYLALSILCAVLSVGFVIVYYNDLQVVQTCFRYGVEVRCPP